MPFDHAHYFGSSDFCEAKQKMDFPAWALLFSASGIFWLAVGIAVGWILWA